MGIEGEGVNEMEPSEGRPPTESGDNGEEVLVDDGADPAGRARQQADQIADHRTSSDAGQSAPRREGERQPGEAG